MYVFNLSILDLITGNCEMANFLFLKSEASFTARQVVRILRPEFSLPGSNRRDPEELVMTKFFEFLKLCEGKSCFCKLNVIHYVLF